MPKALSSNEAKQRWGSLIAYVSEQNGEEIVESHGKPKAVVLSIAAYEEFQALCEQKRHTDALERLRRLHEGLSARNEGTSEEAAIAFADRLAHELIDGMAARGEISFERDRR